MRYNVPKNCAALLCRTQRRVAHMCSSTVSDTANRLRKTRKKKSSVVLPFRSGHMSAICARLGSKGKVGVQRGRKTAGCPSFLPPRRAPRRSRRPQTANPLAEVQRKTLRPERANTLTQFAHPGFPVQKRSRPVRANPLTQFARPGQPVQKIREIPKKFSRPKRQQKRPFSRRENVYPNGIVSET